MKKKKVIISVGARPNFMKAAPIILAMKRYPSRFAPMLVHTGQHYDYAMSKVFFNELGLYRPDRYLNVGSGSHGSQTAHILERFEKILVREKPDLVIVVGDVNSTLACALDAVKLCIAHILQSLNARIIHLNTKGWIKPSCDLREQE